MFDIQIVDYSKKYEKDINKMLLKQWNIAFEHQDKYVGKVALVNDKFAGLCYGYIKKDYFYLDTLCVKKNYRNHGIGSNMLNNLIIDIQNNYKNLTGGVHAYLLDNDGGGPRVPMSKNIFEKFGFMFETVKQGYFAKDNDYDYCPDCKSKPCICSGWKYVLSFDNFKPLL